jgi:dimethylargininase
VSLGKPNAVKVKEQYRGYCNSLARCGVALTILEADPGHPDSTFVEDTAVLIDKRAILTRPGAKSREGEVNSIREALTEFFPSLAEIKAPGTVDGGDICEAEKHFFIGLSRRTNQEGARQLAQILTGEGYTSSVVDIRAMKTILHLKSGISYVGRNRLVVIEEMVSRTEFAGYALIPVNAEESYAANCVHINDHVLIPSGYPALKTSLERLGYPLIPLEMSEFQKMDGGLSCLSLRF